MKTTLHLEARKKEAFERFRRRMKEARTRADLPDDAMAAFLLGLQEGYDFGLSDGVRLGIETESESNGSYRSSRVGIA